MNTSDSSCICQLGDPCDYHLATCIICERPCKGHPNSGPRLRTRFQAVEAVVLFLRSFGDKSKSVYHVSRSIPDATGDDQCT